MSRRLGLLLGLEMVALAITALIAFAVMLPILNAKIDFPYFWTHILYIIVFCTAFRYLFFTKYSWIDLFMWLKAGMVGLSLLLLISLVYLLFQFNGYINEQGLQDLTAHLKFKDQVRMMGYIRKSFLISAVAAIISSFLLPFKLLVSIWRDYNEK